MSESAPTAHTGKIGRCPPHIRDEVNRRLLNGEPASKILPWLNSQEVVLRVLDEHFGEEPVTPQNLSEWRKGGYAAWLKRRERLANLKELSAYAATLGEAAGGNATDGSAAILGGRILERIETALEANDDATLAALVDPLVKLRGTDLEARKARQRERLLDQKERQVALSEKQFQVRSCELFIAWAKNAKALEIAQSAAPEPVKMDQLHLLIFGEPPKPTA
jgi:hypothetical protein